MHPALARNLYLVKEHVGFFRVSSNYDIFDPETQQIVLHCREEKLGWLTKLLRLTDYRTYTPFDVQVRDPQGGVVVRISRGVKFLRSRVTVRDERDERLGTFAQRLLSIGGAFDVLDAEGTKVCALQGRWTGWEFTFSDDSGVLAKVSKKWSGLGKEFFTSADNYMLAIEPRVPPDAPVRMLILGAVLCIDRVLKE